MQNILYTESPIGLIEIAGNGTGITSVWFVEKATKIVIESILVNNCAKQLAEYFAGNRKEFDVPIALEGTPFQKQVWEALLKIPYGTATAYLPFTQSFTDAKAIRAVAGANSKNPVGIIVPCHRVIGSDGSLTGYAGGLWRKRWLLEHEQKIHTGSSWQLF